MNEGTPEPSAALAQHEALVAALRDPSAYAHPVGAVEVVQTHLSTVLLAGEFAYKMKKPLDLGFADFTTLERRRAACADEVRLNRRTAPALYLDVVPVTRDLGGRLRLGGPSAAVDYAVRMRRFAEDARADRLAAAGRLDERLVDRLAASVARLHARADGAPRGSGYGAPDSVRYWVASNTRELLRLVDGDDAGRVAALQTWSDEQFARRALLFAERGVRGFVRECHGDLHLGNVVRLGDDLVPFDCIEFNPELRFIDVMSDVAFAWMDLIDHGLPRLAARFLSGYVEATGDYAGLASLPYYAVYRALVRAKVALIRRAQRGDPAPADGEVARYLNVAEAIARPGGPAVVLVTGVTGSGKSTVAQHLVELLGAVRVRSDVERKRLAGLAAADHSQAGVGAPLYDAAMTRRTYEQLERAATLIVDADFPALVDATFLRRDDRAAFVRLAQRLGVPVALVVCTASETTLRARVAARAALGADASDATLEVLAAQLEADEPAAGDELAFLETLDTDADRAAVAQRSAVLAERLRARFGAARGR